jgi:hypothetical protein
MIGSLGAMIVVALGAGEAEAHQPDEFVSMVFLLHADPQFREGLDQLGLAEEAGFRCLNTGFVTTPFEKRWKDSAVLEAARASGRPYYVDRITGGMPFQPLTGIQDIARVLKDDPKFLGFQVHEWGNSPIHDYHRVKKLLLDKKRPFDAEHFAEYEGRSSLPYFSGGNFDMYRDVYRPLNTQTDVESYFEAYFRKLIEMTQGQVASVNGHMQFHHAALRLGAKNVMAEVGNQVPLTALQVACVRGAATEYGKPFGLYYETWGGSPFGCACATDFSPWFATREQFEAFHEMGSVGPQYGSGRSLQRRLLFFGWLAGASYWAEEWGAENVYSNWETHPLTEYGRVIRDFVKATGDLGPIAPVVPAALVLPRGAFGVDALYVAGFRDRVFGVVGADTTHQLLREFASQVLVSQARREGGDAHNLTPSPWIGSFDVLSGEAPEDLLSRYAVLVFLDAEQAKAAVEQGPEKHVFTGEPADTARYLKAVGQALPFRVEGQVGCAQARSAKGRLVGVFNNLGVTKTDEAETFDPEATKTATVIGPCAGMSVVYGGEHIREASSGSVKLELPAGSVAILLFPEE